MKKAYILGGLIAAAIAPAAMAIPLVGLTGTLTLTGDGEAGGGILTANETGALSGTGVQTFCLESLVNAEIGVTYNYITSLSNDKSGAPNVPPFLTQGTADLYNGFLNHSLTANGGTLNASLLQGAIWYLQGQSLPTGANASHFNISATNPYYVEAQADLGGFAGLASTGLDNVVVLDLTAGIGPNGAPFEVQNLLGQIPNPPPTVPDGGSTVGLLGFALLGFEALRRRLAR